MRGIGQNNYSPGETFPAKNDSTFGFDNHGNFKAKECGKCYF